MGHAATATVGVITAVDPDDARERAREIVDGLGPNDPPRPLRGLLDWIGDRLQTISRPFRWLFAELFSLLPDWLAWLVLVAAAAALAWLVVRAVRARVASAAAPAHARREAAGEDPARLERDAAAAAARGDHALAVRLRFRAGLLRLDHDAHVIHYRPGLGNQEVRDTLGEPRFDDLADTFDRVTYGDAEAEPLDSDTARAEWPEVVKTARRG
jgi:hypothetical protein